MSTSVSVDGGWWILLPLGIFILLCAVALRKTRGALQSAAREPGLPGSGTTKPKEKQAKAVSSNDHGGHARHGRWDGFLWRVFKLILLVTIGGSLVWLALTGRVGQALVWVCETVAHVIFDPSADAGGSRNRPSARASDPSVREAKAIIAAQEERERIEAERHSVAFNYEVPPPWIHNPPGYYATGESEGGKAVVVQCSASERAPSRKDTELASYQCPKDTDSLTNWWRPLAVSPEEGPVNVQYRFRHK